MPGILPYFIRIDARRKFTKRRKYSKCALSFWVGTYLEYIVRIHITVSRTFQTMLFIVHGMIMIGIRVTKI